MSFITALQMSATHQQSAPAHFYDYFRLASRQMHSLLSLAHVDRMTSIYTESTYQFALLSRGATRSLNTQRTSFRQQATRFLPLWRSQHKTPCLQVSSPQSYITESHRWLGGWNSPSQSFQIPVQGPDISTEVSCGLLPVIRSNARAVP